MTLKPSSVPCHGPRHHLPLMAPPVINVVSCHLINSLTSTLYFFAILHKVSPFLTSWQKEFPRTPETRLLLLTGYLYELAHPDRAHNIKAKYKIRYLFHGDDWSPDTDEDLRKGKEYIESIGGELIQPKYYHHQSTTKIIIIYNFHSDTSYHP